MDRSAQPLYIIDDRQLVDKQPNEVARDFEDSELFNNRLNAYMDHGWDGAYTSQKRE